MDRLSFLSLVSTLVAKIVIATYFTLKLCRLKHWQLPTVCGGEIGVEKEGNIQQVLWCGR
jgi:hypothetical protein